ncbi:MAG TPA: CDP-alcohol phosphatidyltransferase family protein [Streptosporangiaceae bacterium]|jgi:phosphatidylglycerophosphate synthase|nr:CDP-alcohol phosphatidyltransferase family protein [Streptosporangiaceae bacterium]
MLDARMRTLLRPVLDAAGRRIARAGIPPAALTATGWAAGAGACVATALRAWPAALGLWLANRLLDGLDGPVARAGRPSDAGGFADIVADFSVYAGIILGLAIAVPGARLACVALLCSYYVSGTAFLALSSLAERRRQQLGDDRSLRFVGGLAEGTETIVVYVLLLLLPSQAVIIVWVFTGAVTVTAVHRVVIGLRLLAQPTPGAAGTTGTAETTGTAGTPGTTGTAGTVAR